MNAEIELKHKLCSRSCLRASILAVYIGTIYAQPVRSLSSIGTKCQIKKRWHQSDLPQSKEEIASRRSANSTSMEKTAPGGRKENASGMRHEDDADGDAEERTLSRHGKKRTLKETDDGCLQGGHAELSCLRCTARNES